MARIGIFGGSFNPPHRGHLLAAREQKRLLQLDQVILIPALIPPHKQLADGSPDPSFRMAMTEALVQGDPALTVSDIELKRVGPSYTADTLAAIHARQPEDELFLLMGTDMFLSFHTWSRPEVICRYATICLAVREKPSKKDEAAIRDQTRLLQERFGARVERIKNEYEEMSSTLIRRMLQFDCAEEYLTPEVLQIIRENGLYGTDLPMQNLPYDTLRERSLALHKEKRRDHVIGCSETAKALAEKWGADPALAQRAGILHDITKALDKPAHLALCKKYGTVLRNFEIENEKLLHSKSGAAVAGGVFGECPEVVSAIYWHTTGKADMSLLEKIVYMADYMEPNRVFEGVEELRELAWADLNRAMLRAFEISVEMLEQRGRSVDVHSRQALEFMQKQLGIKEKHGI